MLRDSAFLRPLRPASQFDPSASARSGQTDSRFTPTKIRLNFITVTASLLLSCALSGCMTASSRIAAKNKVGVPTAKVFYAKYDEVESALKQAMIKYPQRVDNSDAGIFETDYLKGDARFKPAHNPDIQYSNGYRYKIVIRVVKGHSERPATKVQVTKVAEVVRDFFSMPEAHTSDGLEESAILYRIAREITIARALVKASETPATPPVDPSQGL